MILLIGYIVFCLVLITLFLLGKLKSILKSIKQNGETYKTTNISVIIPFRNEEENIPTLIHSIENLTHLPLEFIWVNDHSTDNSVSILRNSLPTQLHQIIELPVNLLSKKNALLSGIAKAKGTYILTWDADISIQPNYFQKLASYPTTQLAILPVEMQSANRFSHFFATEFQFLGQLNTAIYGLKRPILANGANLIFDKNTFDSSQPFNSNIEIASGDDQFLLKRYNDLNLSISLIQDHDLIATTSTPTSIFECLKQRIRWASKTKKVNDLFANFIGIIGAIYHFTPILFLTSSTTSILIIYTLKITLDFIILNQHFNLKNLLNAAFFSLIYPVYAICLLIYSLFGKVEWKERKYLSQ